MENILKTLDQLFPQHTTEVEQAVQESAGDIFGGALQTVFIGLVVVIGALLVLTGIFYLFGAVMSMTNKPKKAKKGDSKMKSIPAPEAKPAPAAAPAPVVQNGISDEVVAAIAAAVAMMAPEGKRYAVKSVARANGNGRSAWAAAGIADNTRPF